MNEICKNPGKHKRFVMLKTKASIAEYAIKNWDESPDVAKEKQFPTSRRRLVRLGINK
jgi:hypothetical protein